MNATDRPQSAGLVSKFARGDEQGFALGTLAAVQSIVSVLGPAIFGGALGGDSLTDSD